MTDLSFFGIQTHVACKELFETESSQTLMERRMRSTGPIGSKPAL